MSENKDEKKLHKHDEQDCCCGHEHEGRDEHDKDCCCGHEHEGRDEHDNDCCCGHEHEGRDEHGNDCCCENEHDEHEHNHKHKKREFGSDISCGCGHCGHDGDDDDDDDDDCCCGHEHDGHEKHEKCEKHNHDSHCHGHEHGDDDDDDDEDGKADLIKIIISAVLFAGIIVAEKLGAFGSLTDTKWMLLFFAVPYLVVGYETIFGAFRNILHGELFDEQFLMAVASIAAFAIGKYDEAVAVMLLFHIGELFEDYAVGKSRASITELMDIAPEFANLVKSDGSLVKVDPEDVKVGSIIVVKPGERVPLDSIIIEGESFVDTAALTGESVPRKVTAGEAVISGCINGQGTLKCRTEKEFEDSTVSRILDLVENASSKKSHAENFITRFAKYYTPIVTVAAILLAVIPSIITGDWMEWIRRACTFLVISCPCALVISVPLGFFGGIGAASKIGVLVKGSNYLEAASKLGIIAFDKTGTLTKGEFAVSKIVANGIGNDELLALAAAIEQSSSHPIAMSIVEAAKKLELPKASAVSEIPGHGLYGVVDGERIYVGNEKLMRKNDIEFNASDEYGTIIYAAKGNKFLGTIIIADGIKDGVREALESVKASGVSKTVMLTGDVASTAQKVAKEAGVDEFFSDLLPADKVSKVEQLLEEINGSDKKLAFVGDGINDAPVLMRADVGIAMGSMGSDSAIEAADIVIMDDDISKLSGIVKVARKTMRIVKQNIVVALGVKAVVLIMGAFGFASMWLAVFADVGVSMLAILNSMRALRVSK